MATRVLEPIAIRVCVPANWTALHEARFALAEKFVRLVAEGRLEEARQVDTEDRILRNAIVKGGVADD